MLPHRGRTCPSARRRSDGARGSRGQLLLLRLDPRARVYTLGKGVPPVDAPYFYVD
ncbi:MAG: hypothetical protein RML56_12205 [Burkholderiales bacterium]|nr:hypothetical protein [Burkholderiales bacterium]